MQLETYMFHALKAEFGIKIITSNPTQLRQKLYPIRRANPEFENLAFIISPTDPDNELWIMKKGTPVNATEIDRGTGEEDPEPSGG